jgi:hypothetical protein
MTVAINDLTSATALSTADQVPISSGADRDTRKMSLSLLLSWLQSNLTFTAAKPVQQFAVPTTGQTVTVAAGDSWLVLTPAGTLAALTVNLPTSRTDGQTVLVNSTQILTSLTVSGAGTTVNGAPTTLAAVNGFFEMRYTATLNAWFRTG